MTPDLPRREPYRTWPGSLIVLAIIVAYVAVWVVLDEEISPELRPVAAGTTQVVVDGITYVPVDGTTSTAPIRASRRAAPRWS